MSDDKPLPCPCGATHTRPSLWRRGASHRYVLRCPVCKRESRWATTDFEKLNELWNQTVAPANQGSRPC